MLCRHLQPLDGQRDGELLSTFSIITTGANPMMSRIHNLKQRMPVILSPDQYSLWLEPDLSRDEIMRLLTPTILA
ncbi:MAG: SOS response-associated peptidase family protein [Chitinophagaceae bacterium]|nr:SOS response-associated peptidase family protein [Chitinophagaceae bacterium]